MVPGWLQQIPLPTPNDLTLEFGVRAAAIVVVVIASLVLGGWVRGVISRIPTRGAATGAGVTRFGHRVVSIRTVSSRALGWFAYLCVLLAGAVAILAIINYGQRGTQTIDPREALRTFENLAKPVIAVLLLVPGTLAVARFLQRHTLSTLDGRVDTSLQALGGRLVYLVVVILGLLVILSVLGVPLALLLTFVGVFTLALSLALQDVLRNLFAGVYLLVERPFVIGDEITVGAFAGLVEDIQLRITSLRARDGQRVLVPNSILFTSTVVNATAQDRRPASLSLTLPSTAAKDFGQLEERILSTLAQVKAVRQKPAPSVMLSRAGQGKLDVRLEFWVTGTEDEAQAAVSDAITQLAAAFSEAEVSVAAPAAAS